jgi:hypothetical protein
VKVRLVEDTCFISCSASSIGRCENQSESLDGDFAGVVDLVGVGEGDGSQLSTFGGTVGLLGAGELSSYFTSSRSSASVSLRGSWSSDRDESSLFTPGKVGLIKVSSPVECSLSSLMIFEPKDKSTSEDDLFGEESALYMLSDLGLLGAKIEETPLNMASSDGEGHRKVKGA